MKLIIPSFRCLIVAVVLAFGINHAVCVAEKTENTDSEAADFNDGQGYAAGTSSPWSFTITAGYDSRYVLYGYRLSHHLYRADLYAYRPVNDRFSIWAGAWAGALEDGTYREVDVYAGFDVVLTDNLSAGLGYSLFNYIKVPFSERDHNSEVALQVVYTLGNLTLTVKDQYDFEAKGHLLRGIAEYQQALSESVSASLEAEYGYAFKYYIEDNRSNHALFTLRVPWQVTDAICVEPFVAHTLALSAIEDFEEDDTYWGLALSWTF